MSGITNNKGRDRFFSATYRSIENKRRKLTTKSEDEHVAREISNLWCDIENNVYSKQSAESSVQNLHEKLEKIIPETDKNKAKTLRNFQAKSEMLISEIFDVIHLSIREAVLKWLQTKQQLAPSSQISYKTNIDQFLEYLGGMADCSIRDFQICWLDDFARDLFNTYKVVTSTVNSKRKTIKQFLRYCYTQDYTDKDYGDRWARYEKPKQEKLTAKTRRRFSENEIQKLLSSCSGIWRDVTVFAIYTGQRLGDIVTAKHSDFKLNSEYKYWKFCSIKLGRSMEIPLLPEVMKIIKSRGNESDYLFPELAERYLKPTVRNLLFSSI